MLVLVLSHFYEPIKVVSWQRGFQLWYTSKAEVLSTYPNCPLRTVSESYEMPAVVRFTAKQRSSLGTVRFSRGNVYLRDGGLCQYCGTALGKGSATFDHIIPRAQGGPTTWQNIVTCCFACNQKKGGRTPQEAGMRLRRLAQQPTSLLGTLRILLQGQTIPEEWKPYIQA